MSDGDEIGDLGLGWLLFGAGQLLFGLGPGAENAPSMGYRQAVAPARLQGRMTPPCGR